MITAQEQAIIDEARMTLCMRYAERDRLPMGLPEMDIPTSGLRPSSFSYLRRGGVAHGGGIKLATAPGEAIRVIDGRHRLLLARETGATVPATVFHYDSKGHCVGTSNIEVAP